MIAKVMTMVGSAVCLFLFTRHQFNWNEQNFSTFSTVNTFVGVGGTVLMTVVGLKILKLGDTFVAIISTACCVATDLTIAFAPEDPKMAWILYLGNAKLFSVSNSKVHFAPLKRICFCSVRRVYVWWHDNHHGPLNVL